jgi:hypothetical protein
VLDLGDSNKPYVMLYQSQGEVERYVCLSHCWGPRLLLRTLSTNIESHQERIPWDALPLTYQETIVFVRKLQIRYLWIDSLCIIQDDEDDWREEAAKMASIYRGSYLTISAPMSAIEGRGLYSDAAPEYKPHRLTYPDSNGRPQAVYARLQLSHAYFRGFMDIHSNYQKLPIFERAWVFQERLLSPRVLHFAPEELNWECLAETVCECSGTVSNAVERPGMSVLFADTSELSMSPKRYYSFARLSSIDERRVEDRWRNLVEEYTPLELTYERDIFPAISGLAKEFNRVRKCAYFAGLWETSLLKDMLWHAWKSNTGVLPCRPKDWRAPTWSWASVKGRIHFEKPSDLLNPCEVLSIHCSPAGSDPTGQLTGGHMLLRGRIFSSVLQYRPQTQWTSPSLSPKDFDLGLPKDGRIRGPAYSDYNFLIEGPGYIKPGTTIYFLRVGQAPESVAPSRSHFLILKCVGDDLSLACRVYERIGLFMEYYEMNVDSEETVVKIV